MNRAQRTVTTQNDPPLAWVSSSPMIEGKECNNETEFLRNNGRKRSKFGRRYNLTGHPTSRGPTSTHCSAVGKALCLLFLPQVPTRLLLPIGLSKTCFTPEVWVLKFPSTGQRNDPAHWKFCRSKICSCHRIQVHPLPQPSKVGWVDAAPQRPPSRPRRWMRKPKAYSVPSASRGLNRAVSLPITKNHLLLSPVLGA